MKKFILSAAFLTLMSWQAAAQFGCGTGIPISNGYTQLGITTPGTAGPEDWNVNPTGTSINASYWDDDVYLFEYTAGATAENISMTIFSRNSWFGIGIFDNCIGTTFDTELDAVGSTTGNVSSTVSATIAAGNTVYIAVGQWGTPNDLDFDVTDFTVTQVLCADPSALTVTNITLTSADLGWTDNAGVSLWDIEWGATPFVPTGTPNITGTTTNPHNLTGLTANTSYEFYVRADCGGSGTSAWVGPYSFYTGYCTPSSSGSATYVNNFSTTNGSVNISNLASGFTAGGYYDGTAQSVQSFATGSFDFNAAIVGGTAGFSIWVDWNNDYIFDNLTEKEFNTTAYGNGPFIGTITIPGGTPIGSYRMRITTDWNASNPSDPCANATRAEFEDYMIDVVAPPSCTPPSVLTATNVTLTSADLGWTENGTATTWDIEWGATPFVPTGTPNITGTTTNPHNLTGLTANTSYEFYVRADCGGSGTSTWSGPYPFYTGYCTPSSSGSATYVDNFSTTNGSINISNLASGFTAGGYYDGTAQSVQSYANGSFNFNADIVGGTAGFSIWVDWNNDLIFDNLTEKEFNTTAYASGPFTGAITIPGATPIGSYTMRITTDWNASNPSDPCANTTRAEFEDYTINVVAQAANDLGVISIQSAPAGCGLGMETVTVQVKNYGTSTQSGFDVAYSLNGTPVASETVVGSVLSGDTLTHVFTAMANMSTPNVYTIDAWSLLGTDTDNSNDTLTGWMTEHLTSSLTYNGAATISSTIPNGSQTIICTNGLVNNMLDSCYTLSALVIDSMPHTWETDIDMWLISPAGDTLEVSTDNGSGSGSDGYINVTFTDSASTSIVGQTNLTNGFFTTEEAAGLAKFNGTDPNGAWTLHVIDDTGGDDGVLYQWHLEFLDNSFMVNLGADSNACSTDMITLDAGAGNYSYSWSTGDNTQQITIDTNSLGGNGTYNISVVVTDTISGCQSMDTIIINYSVCTGVNAFTNNVNVNVSPNPNNGQFTLNVNTIDVNELTVKVVNLQGQEVYNKSNFDNLNRVNEQINLSNNANGIYFIIVTTDKGIVTHKMIVQ